MDSEVNGLRRADRLTGGGALVLLAVLFLAKWYEASGRLGSAKGLKVLGGSFSGWQAFTHSRWVWLLTGVVALAAVSLTLTHRSSPGSERCPVRRSSTGSSTTRWRKAKCPVTCTSAIPRGSS